MYESYIHYGSTSFDPSKGFPVQNRKLRNKPKGGLWASRVTATQGWRRWCESAELDWIDPDTFFRFRFKPDAQIAYLYTLDDLYALPGGPNDYDDYLIDFEACLRSGIDAIELCYFGKEFNENPSYSVLEDTLYSVLWGWDCDSVVVLNPDAIEVIGNV